MQQRIITPPRHTLRVSGHWMPSMPGDIRWSVMDLHHAPNGVPTGTILLTDTSRVSFAPLDPERAIEALESLLVRWRLV